MSRTATRALTAAVIALTLARVAADQGILVVQVADPAGRPLQRVRLSPKGGGGVGPPTDVAGRTRVPLATATRPAAIIALSIVAPDDLVFISPWDSQLRVPPFENESQNFATVVLAKRGERTLLEDPKTLMSILANVNRASSPAQPHEVPLAERRTEALNQVAAAFGLKPNEVELAISSFRTRPQEAYERGMAALFDGDLSAAADALVAAVKEREERFGPNRREPADAAFFLGRTLYEQAKYAESATAYRKALALRPGDPATMNNLGLSLSQAGDYAGAEPLLRASIQATELAKRNDDPDLVFPLNNLGGLLVLKGTPEAAEPLFRRGLAIREAAFGQRDTRTANSLNNVASVLLLRGDDSAAEPLLARAKRIFAEAPVPGEPDRNSPVQRAIVVGGSLTRPGPAAVQLNQSTLERHRGHFDVARRLAEDVMRDQIQMFGSRDPEIAAAAEVLAQAELAAKQYDVAGRYFGQVIAVLEGAMGADHPALAEPLAGLGDALAAQKQIDQAAASYRRAIMIRRLHFGEADRIAADLAARLTQLR